MPKSTATRKRNPATHPPKKKTLRKAYINVKYHLLCGESNVPNQTLRPDNVLQVLLR